MGVVTNKSHRTLEARTLAATMALLLGLGQLYCPFPQIVLPRGSSLFTEGAPNQFAGGAPALPNPESDCRCALLPEAQ